MPACVCAKSLQSTLCDPMDCNQAPLPTGLSRQECWGGLPCPPPGELPDPGIETVPPVATALQADSLPLSYWEAPIRAYCMPDPESGSGGMKTVRRHAACSCSGCTLHNPEGHRIV